MALTALLLRILISILVSLVLGMFIAVAWGLRELLAGRRLLPWSPAREVPWRGLDVFGVLFIWVVVNVAVAAVLLGSKPKELTEKPAPALASEAKKVAEDGEKKPPASSVSLPEQMLAMTWINAVLVVIVPLFLRWTCGASLADIGFSTRDLARNVRLGFVAFLVSTPMIYVVFGLAQLIWRPNKHPIELMMMKEMSPSVAVIAFMSAVIFAPLAEELIFRSVLQGWLTRWFRRILRPRPIPVVDEVLADAYGNETFGTALLSSGQDGIFEIAMPEHDDRRPEYFAIGLTSLFFALAHAPQMPAPVPLFALSVVLGILINRTGSLVPAIVVHAMFNGLSTIGLFIKALGPGS